MTAQASNPSEQPKENYSEQDMSFVDAICNLVCFAEDSYAEKDVIIPYFLAFRCLSCMAYSLGAPASQISDVINQAVNFGLQDCRTAEEEAEFGEDE